jgi:hypothetical protein
MRQMASNINENTDEQVGEQKIKNDGSIELFEDLGSDKFM